MRRRVAGWAVAGAAAGAAIFGCKDRAAKPAEQTSAAQEVPKAVTGPRPLDSACGIALSGLDVMAAEDRVIELLQACEPCDTSPILLERRGMRRTASYLAELDASIAACGGFCTKLARMEFGRNIQAQLDSGEPSARPWRDLAAACPEAIGLREESRGYLGATWFVLERIARAAEREHAGPLARAEQAPFPLPAVAGEGRGLELPSPPSDTNPAALKLPGRLVITVLAADVLVGRLPWGKLSRSGVIVDGDYPGASVAQSQSTLRSVLETVEAKLATAAIAPQTLALPAPSPPASAPSAPSAPPSATIDDLPRPPAPPPSHGTVEIPLPSLAVPYGLPATRLIEVLTQLGRPARLLVQPASSLPDYAPPMALPPILTAIGPNNARTVELADAAALDAIAADPRGAAMPLILAVGPDATVEELGLVLAKLRAHLIVGLTTASSAAAKPTKPAKAPKP